MNGRHTLYAQYKDMMDKLGNAGFQNLKEASKHFYRFADMDRELGYSTGACIKWFKGDNMPTFRTEKMARKWLDETFGPGTGKTFAEKAVRAMHDQFADVAETVSQVATPSADTKMYIVICPENRDRAFQKLATALGCEVEEL